MDVIIKNWGVSNSIRMAKSRDHSKSLSQSTPPKSLKVPEGQHPRGTTLCEALQGNLPRGFLSWGAKKPINRKHINIFLTALAGQSSQGRTPTRPRDKRDKMAILLWNSTENSRFVPGIGPTLFQGRVPVCPRDGSCLSRTPSRQKCLCLLVFSCPT